MVCVIDVLVVGILFLAGWLCCPREIGLSSIAGVASLDVVDIARCDVGEG